MQAKDLKNTVNVDLICAHCGDQCSDDSIQSGGKCFCCTGCLFVYELLNDNNLDNYYTIANKSGLKPAGFDPAEFAMLDDKDIKEKLLQYSINGTAKVNLDIPEIYCSACIWLLENLYRLDHGIYESKANFLSRELSITYDENTTSLRKIIELLTSLGYKPRLNLSNIESKKPPTVNKSLYMKLGVAGFAFGNVMLFALPGYISGGLLESEISHYFGYLSLLLAAGVAYASTDFFKAAWTGLKLRHINIDLPISLGILTLLFRSVYDILSATGSGYIDSLSGLVFFLLIGRVFRQKTYHRLAFDRDYKSYFPLSVIKKTAGSQEFIPLKKIKQGDKLIIRNNEIIPTDSGVLSRTAMVDYSFLTGESTPVEVRQGDKIYAGGINLGSSIEVSAIKLFEQSRITGLWNQMAFKKKDISNTSHVSDIAAKYFTIIILTIALASLAYWLPTGTERAFNAFTSVLIIACPCAIALAIPFAYGTALRIFGNNSFFLKKDTVVERMANVASLIFDKTGTLTDISKSNMEYTGKTLSADDCIYIKSTARHSTHPVSRLVYLFFKEYDEIETNNLFETTGQGIDAVFGSIRVRLGKLDFVRNAATDCSVLERTHPFIPSREGNKRGVLGISPQSLPAETTVYISINNILFGYFTIKPKYRENLTEALKIFLKKYRVYILSGDKDFDRETLKAITSKDTVMHFNKLPVEKLEFIKALQSTGQAVMMVGDGLNDSGALRQSDVGIAVTDSNSNFTPGSDAILIASNLFRLPDFIELAKSSVRTVYFCYTISVLYNLIGLFFAVQGSLSPVIAAILMPISSISIMLIAVLGISYKARRLRL